MANAVDFLRPAPPVPAPLPVRTGESSLNRHALLGVALIVGVLGGLVWWSSVTNVAGAVVGHGTIAVEDGSKLVQHPEGGVVAEIYVRNEDVVDGGQLLLRLDGTATAVNLQVVMTELNDALARQARLRAESTGQDKLEIPEIADNWPDRDSLTVQFAAQQTLLETRKLSISNQHQRLDEQIAQLERQIEGLQSQREALSTELAILDEESTGLEKLYADGLIQLARLNENKRVRARQSGELGRIDAEVARIRGMITERAIVRDQVVDGFRAEVLADLQTASVSVLELLQKKIAAEDRLARLEIRAPQSGIIHQSIVQTVGGVVAAGATLMMVVPQQTALVVNVRLSPLDIDKVYVGQSVTMRLASFDPRTTPELQARVSAISPDLTVDRVTGVQYYEARVDLTDDELARLPPDLKLVPGMPAEVFINIGDRTVLAYLTKPLTDQINRAFRED